MPTKATAPNFGSARSTTLFGAPVNVMYNACSAVIVSDALYQQTSVQQWQTMFET